MAYCPYLSLLQGALKALHYLHPTLLVTVDAAYDQGTTVGVAWEEESTRQLRGHKFVHAFS